MAACDITPLTSPLPTPEPQFHTMAPAYPGPAQGTDNVPIILPFRTYFPRILAQHTPSKLGWEAASDGQALAARAAILALSPGTVRTGIAWRNVEPVRGAGYIWSASKDQHINLLAEGGNRIIGILLWSPQWAVETPGCSPVAPAYYSDWLAFVRAAVERYGDRIDVWEVQNEMDAPISPEDKGWGCAGKPWLADKGGTEWGKFVAMTADVIRAEQPSATILSGGLLLGCDVAGQYGPCTGDSLTFFAAALPYMRDHIDGVGFHSYDYWTKSPPTNTASLDAKVVALRKLTTLPLWLTEGGMLCHRTLDQFLCASQEYEEAQADYIHLWGDSCRRLGLESCVHYSITKNGWAWADCMNNATTPRLCYFALQDELRK